MKYLLLWGMALVLIVGCSVPRPKTIPEGVNAFGMDLYREFAGTSGNMCFSPVSASAALTMAAAGARGATATQMADVLYLPGPPENAQFQKQYCEVLRSLKPGRANSCQIAIVNGVWPRAGLEPDRTYLTLLSSEYRAKYQALDYSQADQAAATINEWVSRETAGRIDDLISPDMLDPQTTLVLTNATYFNGDWESPFDEHATASHPFHTRANGQTNAMMMKQTTALSYFENDRLQAVEMAYKGGEYGMIVILPKETEGLAALERALDATLRACLEGFSPRQVRILIPRFTLKAEHDLFGAVQTLGMKRAFKPVQADFSGILGRPGSIWIDFLIHKATIEVTEKGTVASAATAVGMRGLGLERPDPDITVFRADHPFVYFIRHKETGAILFMGRVADPSAG